jgi:HEAT repeat protein
MLKKGYDMLRTITALLMFLLMSVTPLLLFGQENSGDDQVLLAFQRSFARGSLSTKVQVLQDGSEMSGEALGPLYQQAVEFILDNIRTLRDDAAAQELAVLAVNLIGIHDYRPAADLVWRLFENSSSVRVQIAVMSTLGVIGTDNPEIVSRLNTWMASQNNAMRLGRNVERQVVAECVATLGKIGNENSYGFLFSASHLKYSDDITYKADRAMEEIDGNYRANIVRVIEQNPPEEKLEALVRATEKEDLGVEDRASIAMRALSYGLENRRSEESEEALLRELRYHAARKLTEYRWAAATDLAIRHFDQTIEELELNRTSTSNMLEAIAFLGSMETHESAVRLSLYLEVMNAYVENGQTVDTQLALAVVNNLGALGDRVAFDYLLYTGYLDYAPPVKRAAREALNNLKN